MASRRGTGLEVKLALDTAHIRSRLDADFLRSAEYYTIFDAEGRRVRFEWRSPHAHQFDVVLDQTPTNPEALAAALRGFLRYDPYVRPLLPLDRLVREMIRVDGAE